MIIIYLIWMFLICHFSPFFSPFLNQSSFVIFLTILATVKELYNVHFPISIYTRIGKYKIRVINFGSRINLNLLFVGELVRNNTRQWLSIIKAKLHTSNISLKPTFNLSSHCQQVSPRRLGQYRKLFVILLYFGKAK